MDEEKKYSQISTEEKTDLVTDRLIDKKINHLLTLDIGKMSDAVDAVVIARAANVRHAQGSADDLMAMAAEKKLEVLGMEGYRSGQWILMDMNDVVVHIMQPDVHERFNLAGLWPNAPVLREVVPQESDWDDGD